MLGLREEICFSEFLRKGCLDRGWVLLSGLFSVRPDPFHLRAPTWSKPLPDNLPTVMNIEKRFCADTYLSDYVHFVFQKNICQHLLLSAYAHFTFQKFQPLTLDLHTVRDPNGKDLAMRPEINSNDLGVFWNY